MSRTLKILIIFIGFSTILSGKNEGARMMVHLLDYIAVDYSMAIQNGEIISPAEYQEMREFASTIEELGAAAPASVQSDIILLKKLIEDKSGQDKISSVATSIKQKIINHYKLEIAPKRLPDIDRGKELYKLQCESCHGPKGFGNGILAADMQPAPTNFHQKDKANGLSPFQAYNTIRLGVEGTAMRPFNELNDDEIWNLAFYALSLPHQEKSIRPENTPIPSGVNLETLASLDNSELAEKLNIDSNKRELISLLRLYPAEVAQKGEGNYLDKAIRLLQNSIASYREGEFTEARNLALTAYLEGVEPVEVQLRANDPAFVAELERQLAIMRTAIENEESIEKVQSEGAKGIKLLQKAQEILAEQSFSGWITFLLAFTIILREGLEAFLVILTFLSIIRSLNIPNASRWVHGGWISAIGMGFLLWIAADRFFTFSGAQREVMEGAIALFAVGVLLYVGFWMHSKSEAQKWQKYVKNRIKNISRKENLVGLAFLSFLVVFREAFESVLFLSALNLEIRDQHSMAFGSGIISAFVLLVVISVLLLRYSKKIPITQLFRYSSFLISILAVILAGKGIHALQEAGMVSIDLFPVNLRLTLLGIYPSWQTILTQLTVMLLIFFLWRLGNRNPQSETKTVKA